MSAKRLTPEVIAQIHARKRDGLSHEQLAVEFKISRGSVTNALKSKPPSLPSGPTSPANASANGGEQSVEPVDGDAPLLARDDLRAFLSGQARILAELSRQALKAGDRGVYLQVARASRELVKELGRFTPPPAPELDAHPDMVAAAQRTREALHALIERELDKG